MRMCSLFHYWDLLRMLGYYQIVGGEFAYDLPRNCGRSWILGGQEWKCAYFGFADFET